MIICNYVVIKGEICNIFNVLNYKMTMVFHIK